MCGIFGVLLRDPELGVNMDALLDSGLASIETRGRDATGFAAVSNDGQVEWQKASCKASVFCAGRRFVPLGTRLMIGHTRLATQGLPSFMENNHPIRRGPYYIVHNGHVRNDDALFEKAERKRFGRVDSEAIAARLASLQDLSALGEVMEEIEGQAAVAAIDERDPSRLVVARGESSPLWVYDGRKIVIFASTKDAVEKAHKECVGQLSESRLHYAEEGEQFEWMGVEEVVRSTFKMPEKPKYLQSWMNGHYAGNYLGQGVTPIQKEKNAKSWSIGSDADSFDLSDWDTLDCDNCNTPISYLEVNYRSAVDDDKKKETFLLCDECSQLWDDGQLLDDEGDTWEELEDEELEDDRRPISELMLTEDDVFSGAYDDYAGANESIIRNFMNRFGI